MSIPSRCSDRQTRRPDGCRDRPGRSEAPAVDPGDNPCHRRTGRTDPEEDDITENQYDPTATGTGSGNDATGATGAADETFAWTAPETEPEGAGGNDARATAERMLGQLQSMIDTVATQAGPVLRQVGVKAAELAAVAADRAGPLAHKAADVTADASGRLAEKSRTWAADMRTRMDDSSTPADAASSASESLGGADDGAEQASADLPAEGRPL